MTILNHILLFFFKKPINKRRYLKDVKPNDRIRIEWYRISNVNNSNRIGELKCLSNDPIAKKILLESKWANFEEAEVPQYEQVILDYNSKELKNFHLLNPYVPIEDTIETLDLKKLLRQKNEALEGQDFEKAETIQKQINKIIEQ